MKINSYFVYANVPNYVASNKDVLFPSSAATILLVFSDADNHFYVALKIEHKNTFCSRFQLLLFCSSLLTPATIFLLITGALNTAFPAFDLINSLVVNAVPVGLFMLTCFFCESKWQVRP